MKLLSFYKWIAGSESDFTKQFQNNEALYNQARAYWGKMESSSSIILLIFIVVGIAMAYYYYLPYNNKPGRHYTPKHWIYFLLGTFGLSFLLTWLFEYIAISPKLTGAVILQLKIAFGNAIYALLLFVITSVVWCNAFKTNACRIFKF